MSPAFFLEQVEAWQFEAFFALVIITNSVFIGVAQLQKNNCWNRFPTDTWWGSDGLDGGCVLAESPEVTIQLESLEDSVYDAWPRPRASQRWRLEGNGIGWSIFFHIWENKVCEMLGCDGHHGCLTTDFLLSLNKIVWPWGLSLRGIFISVWMNTLHFSFRVLQYFLGLELKHGKMYVCRLPQEISSH